MATETIDIDGLRAVVEAVRNAPDDQFDMDTWDCKTAACAAGWFCRVNPGDRLFCVMGRFIGDVHLHGSRATGVRAVAERFGLSYNNACTLFMEHEDDEPRDSVIVRFERFIRTCQGAK